MISEISTVSFSLFHTLHRGALTRMSKVRLRTNISSCRPIHRACQYPSLGPMAAQPLAPSSHCDDYKDCTEGASISKNLLSHSGLVNMGTADFVSLKADWNRLSKHSDPRMNTARDRPKTASNLFCRSSMEFLNRMYRQLHNEGSRV
jgi:hypothetical protein